MVDLPLDGARRTRLTQFAALNRRVIADYGSLLSGSLGRLGFSLVYFIVLANALSLDEFGVFAAASASGVVLSRVAALGFSSPLYRVATVKPRLLGAYFGGYALCLAASLPLVAALGAAAWLAVFHGSISALAFAAIIAAEVLIWRSAEIMIIVNNGLGRFARASMLTISGTAMRMFAALAFAAFAAGEGLERWAWFYVGANCATLLLASTFGRVSARWRLAPRLYGRRMKDALSVAAAEIIFIGQMELDKVLMLALAGEKAAGIYAVIVRLVDLSAVPLRAFFTLMVQRIMRIPATLRNLGERLALEAALALVSTCAMAFAALLLWRWPALLGANIATVAALVPLAILLTAPRNLIEYHSELLYARGATVARAALLVLLALIKTFAMAALITQGMAAETLVLTMVAVFAAAYVVSAVASHRLVSTASQAG
jgi:O-antigen/teichoic acid export membrane protein